MGITIISSIILVSIIVMLLYLYHKYVNEKKYIKLFQAFGFLLIFLQTIIIFLPISMDYANQVTTFKVVSLMFGYLLVAVSFVFELLILKSSKRVKKNRK